MKLTRLISVVFCCTLLLTATFALAQDWPRWRGVAGDAIVTGFSVPPVWPPELTTQWTVTVGPGDSTPALVGDRLYVFTRQDADEAIVCLNAADGRELWRNAYAEEPPTGAAGRHPGPRSSPAVADGMVVTLGARGMVSCLNADTGEVVWRTNPFPGAWPQFFTSMSPLIADGLAILQLGSNDTGAVVAFDLASGEERWRWDGAGASYSSPVLMTVGEMPTVVAMTASSIVGLSLVDGSLLWQVPFVPEGRAYNASTPIVDGDRVIYSGASRGTSAIRIVPNDEGACTIEPLWANLDAGVQYNSPVLQDGLIFGMTSSGNLFCLDAATGATQWMAEESLDRGGFGSLVSVGTALFALPSSGELVAFQPVADRFAELGRVQLSELPIYSFPVLSGNRIFVRNEQAVALLTVQ
jgi:outer membrane protein assembly factor BamB